jgi:hypothetical protein
MDIVVGSSVLALLPKWLKQYVFSVKVYFDSLPWLTSMESSWSYCVHTEFLPLQQMCKGPIATGPKEA